MKKWWLIASVDAVNVDYEQEIESETEPDFWTCYEIAQEHGCDFFYVTEDEA